MIPNVSRSIAINFQSSRGAYRFHTRTPSCSRQCPVISKKVTPSVLGVTPRCRARGPGGGSCYDSWGSLLCCQVAGGDKHPLSEVQGQGRWHFFDRGARPLSGGEHLAYQSGLAGCVREGRVKSDSWPTACLLNGLRKQNIWQLVVQEEYLEHDRYRNRTELYDASRSRMACCECRSLKLDKKKQQNCVFLPVCYCYLKSTGNGMLDL